MPGSDTGSSQRRTRQRQPPGASGGQRDAGRSAETLVDIVIAHGDATRCAVGRWRTRFAQLRLAGIEKDAPGRGRPSRLSRSRVVPVKDVEGASHEEIAMATGLTVPAARTRVHRSRLLLRAQLQGQVGGDE